MRAFDFILAVLLAVSLASFIASVRFDDDEAAIKHLTDRVAVLESRK